MKQDLRLGPDVVMKLIPHRRPFLMVDNVEAYERGDRPRLWASRLVSANEPIFEGHFPALCLWPGVYTIEGMGQASNILALLHFVERGLVAQGHAAELFLDGLRNLELGARLHPGFRSTLGKEMEELLARALPTPESRMGMSAAVDVKLTAPVFAGQRIDYSVGLTHTLDRLLRFEVRAEVAGREVARGVMKGTFGHGVDPNRGDAT